MTVNLQEEIINLWNSAATELNLPPQEDINLRSVFQEAGAASERIAPQMLGPWLTILDKGIQLMEILYFALDRKCHREGKNQFERIHLDLIGAACAHTVAIRKLVTSGLDTTARSTFRILYEVLNTLMIILNNREIREAYCRVTTFDEAKELWRDKFSAKEIEKNIDTIEKEVLGLDQKVRDDLGLIRRAHQSWIANFEHPAFPPALITTRERTASDPSSTSLGSLALCTITSVPTLDITIKALWYALPISIRLITQPDANNEVFHILDPKEEADRFVLMANHVFVRLVLSHWNDAEMALIQAQTEANSDGAIN